MNDANAPSLAKPSKAASGLRHRPQAGEQFQRDYGEEEWDEGDGGGAWLPEGGVLLWTADGGDQTEARSRPCASPRRAGQTCFALLSRAATPSFRLQRKRMDWIPSAPQSKCLAVTQGMDDGDCEEGDSDPAFELAPEWIERFALTEMRRRQSALQGLTLRAFFEPRVIMMWESEGVGLLLTRLWVSWCLVTVNSVCGDDAPMRPLRLGFPQGRSSRRRPTGSGCHVRLRAARTGVRCG